jgi:hypothetical protein
VSGLDETAYVPMSIATGCVEGSPNDSGFGAMVGDEVSWRQRTLYEKVRFAGARILAQDSKSDPERSVSWIGIQRIAEIRRFVHPSSRSVGARAKRQMFMVQYSVHVLFYPFDSNAPSLRNSRSFVLQGTRHESPSACVLSWILRPSR